LKVAFIGLGNMGQPMARHLLDAGFDLTVFDVSPALRETFGAVFATTASEACEGADIVITMLPNGQIVRDALLGSGGALERARPGMVVLDMSSSDATGTVALGADLKALGFAMVDAPVSGGMALAGQGKLSIMAGTDDADALARCMPVLDALGSKVLPVGKLGAGHAAKAINNLIGAAILGVTSEGMVLARRFGIDPGTMLDVLNSATGRSGISETIFRPHVLERKFGVGFALGLMTKDVNLAASLKDGLGVDLPLFASTARCWNDAMARIGPATDFSAYLTYVEELNGGDAITNPAKADS